MCVCIVITYSTHTNADMGYKDKSFFQKMGNGNWDSDSRDTLNKNPFNYLPKKKNPFNYIENISFMDENTYSYYSIRVKMSDD